jgi:catechol 2,3-dioxygenase-like lactoylglutathione lyase family enzyme
MSRRKPSSSSNETVAMNYLSPPRNRLYASLAALALTLLFVSATFGGAVEIKGITVTVSDLDKAVPFYEQALGFERLEERTIVDRNYDYLTGIFGTRVRQVTLKLGDEMIQLEQFLTPTGQPIPGDARSNDLWFQHFAVVVTDMEKAFDHVRKFPITGISSAPQTIPESNKAAAGIKAYKFKDLDGHPLELLYFPSDKGNPKWHKPSDKLFLGIDHSAIAVSDTDRSTAFYRDLLGFKVRGGSVNTGTTQEQLDNAFGAVVRITGLRPESASGPGLEFLQYVTPSGGRPAPLNTRPNDIVATRVVLEVDDLQGLVTALQQRSVTFISPEVVTVGGMPFSKGLMVKDPDGHALLLVQR